MKKILLGILIALLVLSSYLCKSPASPELPKPKADVRIAVTVEPFLFGYFLPGYYYSEFSLVLSEHNGVQCYITNIVLEFKDGTNLVGTVTYSGDTIPANGSIYILCAPVVWYYFDTMTITVSGQDFNGNSIEVSRIYSWV